MNTYIAENGMLKKWIKNLLLLRMAQFFIEMFIFANDPKGEHINKISLENKNRGN